MPVKWDIIDIIIANFEALGLDGAVFTAGKSGKIPYGQIKKYLNSGGSVINPGGGGRSKTPGKIAENLQFYYHPDHLGSSNYITNASGEVYQHEEYFPFGETFVEERNSAEYTTYLFNGKELDEETGLYYYGARYYDPRTALWISVDPLAEKYAGWSAYQFVRNNPILRIDLNGMSDDGYTVDKDGNTKLVDNTGGKDFDVLYKKENYDAGKKEYDKNGVGEKGIKLKTGILNKGQTQFSEPNSLGEETRQTTYQFTGDEQGESLFRFLSKNTRVEWNLIQHGDILGDHGKNLLVTTHDPGTIESSADILDYINLTLKEKIRYDVHNHPSGSHAASPGDASSWRNIWNLNNPKAKIGIYTSQDNAFTQYFQKTKK